MKFTHSLNELKKAKEIIPEGIKGMHKINKIGEYPGYFVRGYGPYIWDVDGNEYIDYVMGKGPYILGYANAEVDHAVIHQIEQGNIFPMGSPLHTQLALKIKSYLPSAEQILFYKTGSCATAAAVRLARAYTGKDIIVSSGYHGWHDWSNQGLGIPKSTFDSFFAFGYSLNKLENFLDNHAGQCAALIITPEVGYFSQKYYQEIHEICKANHILLILDEVKSGFRVALGGFQTLYNIRPDLSTFSKAMANGYAISAVTGKKEIMSLSSRLHTAGTYEIETIPYVAALTTLQLMESGNVLYEIERSGNYLVENLTNVFQKNGIEIYPLFAGGSFRFWTRDFNLEQRFYAGMAQRGVLFYSYDNSYISYAHKKVHLDRTIETVCEVIDHDLSSYKGRYRPFNRDTLEDLKEIKNKKGFLDDYPGKDGR